MEGRWDRLIEASRSWTHSSVTPAGRELGHLQGSYIVPLTRYGQKYTHELKTVIANNG